MDLSVAVYPPEVFEMSSLFKYTSAESTVMSTIFYLTCFLLLYVLYLIFFKSPASLGPYRWLLLFDLVLSFVNNLIIIVFKPVMVVSTASATAAAASGRRENKFIFILFTGQYSSFLVSNGQSCSWMYFFVELNTFLLMLLSFSVFLTLIYRYRQLLPPYGSYWLSNSASASYLAFFGLVVFILPATVLLRLSRLAVEGDTVDLVLHDLNETVFALDPETPTPTPAVENLGLLVPYSGRLNQFFYLYLTMVFAGMVFTMAVLLSFHVNILLVLKESKKRFLPETFQSQQFVYFVFTIQMLTFILFLCLPSLSIFLNITGILTMSVETVKTWTIVASAHTFVQFLSVVYFIKFYRDITGTYFNQFIKMLSIKSRKSPTTRSRNQEIYKLETYSVRTRFIPPNNDNASSN